LYSNPELVLKGAFLESSICWQSPSNIALIKYWGKYGIQLPQNPSLSITLNNAVTKTKVTYAYSTTGKIETQLVFNDGEAPLFHEKINVFLKSILPIFPFLSQLKMTIESSNTFPHSAGIASSASAMSALALCLCSIENKLFSSLSNASDFFNKASYVARLGSGSASRSVYGGLVLWGKYDEINESSNEFAVPLRENIHPNFATLHDAILIVSDQEKKVSSTKGHSLMHGHPFEKARFEQARANMKVLLSALKDGDIPQFIEVVENEALSLHAMMMTSKESFLLMEPATIHIIDKIRFFRKENKVDICFTLDAGPNIHLIYSEKDKHHVKGFIKNDLLKNGLIKNWIDDCVGDGPKIIKE